MNPKGYVVIQEEDAQIRELLEQWLREAGYLVARRDAVLEMAPALVIVNVPEPHAADGVIRSIKGVYAAPILALSARFRRGLAGSVEAARRLGVKKVLPKPFTRKELLAAVRESVESAP